MRQHYTSKKAARMVEQHKAAVIEELQASAFDLLVPDEVATALDIPISRIPELNQMGWLAPVPGKDVGRAHRYHRWRVELTKRYKKAYSSSRAKKVPV